MKEDFTLIGRAGLLALCGLYIALPVASAQAAKADEAIEITLPDATEEDAVADEGTGSDEAVETDDWAASDEATDEDATDEDATDEDATDEDGAGAGNDQEDLIAFPVVITDDGDFIPVDPDIMDLGWPVVMNYTGGDVKRGGGHGDAPLAHEGADGDDGQDCVAPKRIGSRLICN